MLTTRIVELVGTLPREAKIYVEGAPTATGSPGDLQLHRRACAILDPAFPFKYALAFAQLRQPLPSIVSEPFIKAAYDHCIERGISEEIIEARMIQEHSKWHAKKGFLQALLLLQELRLDEVAAHTGLSVAVVMNSEGLFWSVRDIWNDPLFLNDLAYPETRHVEFKADYSEDAKPRELMIRAAVKNDLDGVMQIFGTRISGEALPAKASADRVKLRLLTDADFVVRTGGSGSKAPVLAAARKLIESGEKNTGRSRSMHALGDEVMGLTAIGLTMGDAIMSHVDQANDDDDYNRRLAQQQSEWAATGHEPGPPPEN